MPLITLPRGITPTAHDARDHTPVAGTVGLDELESRAHSELTGVTSDLHHTEAHTLASHSTKAHSELTGQGTSQYHVKAYCTVAGDGTLQANSFNITSVVRNGAGDYTITIATNFANANWVAVFTHVATGDNFYSPIINAIAVGSVQVGWNEDPGGYTDVPFHFMGAGDQ